jgi:uracil-DNA glycosylase
MPRSIRVWQIVDNAPHELKLSMLEWEARLEGWLEQDIGMLTPDLLVIGK